MDVLLVLVCTFFLNVWLISVLTQRSPRLDQGRSWLLYAFHLLLSFAYYYYVQFNRSDSYGYFEKAGSKTLIELFQSGTPFPSFLAAPFVQLGLSYEAVMLAFAWLGFVGFLYAYALFLDLTPPTKVHFLGLDLLTVILFLPNMHFWTGSLGKGSIIFAGLMLFTYSLVQPKRRIGELVVGSFLTYMIRPHVFLFMLVGVAVGYMLDQKNLGPVYRFFVVGLALTGAFLSSGTMIEKLGLQEAETVEDLVGTFSENAEKQAERLAESGSGVDMNSYSIPFKLITFWFRPLFVDSPNTLGHFSSIENLLYLLIFAQAFNFRFLSYMKNSSFLVKTSIVMFLATSFALTLVMSNLGIILRQKSMVMYFGFLPIYCFLANEAYLRMINVSRDHI